MSTIRLSPESARALRNHASSFGPSTPSFALSRALAELDLALARLPVRPSPKKAAAKKATAKAKRAKKAGRHV